MRRSRLKILPARCLTFLGFILVMLVCPTIAEVNIGIGDVYEPGHSDSELQHPATKFLRNGFEVCQMKDGPRREDLPLDQPPDSRIASLEEAVRFTRKSEPKHLREAISRRGERIQNCYDSRNNEDSAMRRNTLKIQSRVQSNSRVASREIGEMRSQRRNLGNAVSSRTERGFIELPQRTVEVTNEARQRVTSERRNDMIKSHRRTSTVPKQERFEELSYRRKDQRRTLRRNTANDSSRNVDTRRTSDDTRIESSERLSSIRIGAKNSNINERRDDFLRQSTAEREKTVYRFTRRSPSSTRNQVGRSSELVRNPEKERSIVEEERRLKSRGMGSVELRRTDTQRRQTESERRDFARRTVSMTRTSELDPIDRRSTLNTERQRVTREERLNNNMPNNNRRQQRESVRGDDRAVRMTRSLDRSRMDSERQAKFSVLTSDSERRDKTPERMDAARRSVRMVRLVDSLRTDMRSIVENERQQKMRETTVRATRQNENRRLDRLSERGESTRLSLRRFRSLESIPVEKRSIVEVRRHRTSRIQISNAVIQVDNRRQERKSERRDSVLTSTRMVRSVRSMPSDSSMTSKVDSERRQITPDISLNSRRLGKESGREDAIRISVRTVKSVERAPEERRSFLDSERQQRIRSAPLNTIRQTDSRGKQRESEGRDLPQRFVRSESVLTPLYSERGLRARDTASNIQRQQREAKMRDTAHRSSRMVRSVESLERRSILANERGQENRDATYNTIWQDRNRSERRESKRRDLVPNVLKMKRRSAIGTETQERFRDISSYNRRQQRESQIRDTVRNSNRMARSLDLVRTERAPMEERRSRTRDGPMNIRRQEMELGGRETGRRSVRMVRSTESVSQERRSYADAENLERSKDFISNPIRQTDNRRQLREYERRDSARRDVRMFRSVGSISAERRLATNFDRQERFRDITLNTQRNKRELESRDTARRSIRIARSLESLETERRTKLDSERQQRNRDAIMVRSLERRSVIDMEQQNRLPYFASKSRRQERESERRHSTLSTVEIIRSSESNRTERRSMFNFERQQNNRGVSRNIQSREMEVVRRKPELRSVRRVRSAELSPSERSVADIARLLSSSSKSQRRQMESERRDLAQRLVRVARSLKSIASDRTFPVEYERRQIARELTMHTSRQTNNGREQTESEKGITSRRVNRMVRSVGSRDRRSEAGSERHQLTRDATRNFLDQENQTGRRNLARNSRTLEQRNDRQRREIVQRLSLERDTRATSATSNAGRSENSLIASQGKSRQFSPNINYLDDSSRSRRVKESRVYSFISNKEESNSRSVVTRASPNRENALPETSVPPTKEARNIDRRASSNLRTFQNHRLSQIREGRLDLHSRNRRVVSEENFSITIAAGSRMRNQNHPSTRRINHNVPNSISIKMERVIGNKEERFGAMLADTRKWDEKVPFLGSIYMFETQISPDTHFNARKVIVISSDRLLESVRSNAIRNSHLMMDTISRTADLRKKVHAERKSDVSVRISRNIARDSLSRSSKVGRYVLTEHRKDSAERKPLMNSMARRFTALDRDLSMLPSDIRASKTIRRSQLLNGRVNEKIVPKSFQGLPTADSYDAEESYTVILRNEQGNRLLIQLSQNGSSPVTHVREMDQPSKIVQNPKPFEDEEYDRQIGYGFSQDNLFSLTIGGSVAAFLISTSLK